jgi:site-specific recombinase XerD
MHIILYKRHRKDCPHKADKHYKRCDCPVWFETNQHGVQKRQTSGMTTWESAQKKARMAEQQHEDAELGRTAKPGAAKTVKEAVALYTDSKRGEHLAENTLYKHKLTLSRLQAFCDREGLLFIKDVTLAHLTTWRAKWTFDSPLAKRNNQERVKGFFKFAYQAGMIPANPAAQLSSIQVKADEASDVHPLEPSEYDALLNAVPKAEMRDHNAARIKVLMQLQRWSGLSLVDAVCLSKDELIQNGNTFRVTTERRKTGAHINNVIPAWLGRELLAIKNGNPEYFFISGEATPKGAVSPFDKLYRRAFKKAGIKKPGQLSHTLRHTFAVELLKADVDIRKVSKALGHSSVVITERYYAKWNKAQQDILDGDLARAWKK